MIAAVLLMIVAGIGLTQAVSDPQQVTLRWLRLGGLVAVALLAAGGTMTAISDAPTDRLLWISFGVMAVAAVAQLMLVQLGRRRAQRVCALLVFLAAVSTTDPAAQLSYYLGAGLLGGLLMTMLLCHAYLTAGAEMTQRPFMRLVVMLMVLMGLRVLLSAVFGIWPYLQQEFDRPQTWNTMMITARYLAGIVVPAAFLYMIRDCVKRRANQSATGILYVAGVLVIVGEGIALALFDSTGLHF